MGSRPTVKRTGRALPRMCRARYSRRPRTAAVSATSSAPNARYNSVEQVYGGFNRSQHNAATSSLGRWRLGGTWATDSPCLSRVAPHGRTAAAERTSWIQPSKHGFGARSLSSSGERQGARLAELFGLVDGEPVTKTNAELLWPLDPPDAGCKIRAEKAGIGGFICKPTYGREPAINCARRELP
jgi:hypothetical protein